jgi:hypothetical protein
VSSRGRGSFRWLRLSQKSEDRLSEVSDAVVRPPEAFDQVVDFIRGMQRDCRLLLRHLARRPDRTVGGAGAPAGVADGGTASGVLLLDPEAIAKRP